MAQQKVELRQIRDFGQNISDAFLFIKQNGGPLIKSYLAICAIFMLAEGIFTGFYQARYMGILSRILGGMGERRLRMGEVLDQNYFIMLFLSLLTIVCMQLTIGAYMKYYLEHDEKPTIKEVWDLFKKYFLRVFIFNFCAYLAFGLALLACLLPGIYLMIVLTPLTFVIMIEDQDLSGAFQRCFDIIKENFWPSFAIYLVSYLIFSIGGWMVGGTLSIIGGVLAYLSTSDVNSTIGVVSSFLNIFIKFFYIFYFVCVGLNYFSLVEMRDGTGLLGRINEIGGQRDPFNNTEDQY